MLAFLILTFFVLLCALYWPLLFGGECYFSSDHLFYFEPFARYFSQCQLNGQWPLWNPLLHTGMSQLAVPSPGVFYLPHLVFAYLSYGRAIGCLMLLHQMLAGVGTYLFIRNMCWPRISAVAGAIIVTFSGYMCSLNANYTLIETAAWLPINLYLLQCLNKPQSVYVNYFLVVLSSLAFCSMLLAGRPEISFAATGLIFLYLLCQCFTFHGKPVFHGLGTIKWHCVALIVGLCLAMPVLLPVYEWMRVSPRANGLNLDHVFLWSANWYDFIGLLLAQPFGNLQQIGSPFLNLAASRPSYLPYLPSSLVGVVAVMLAVCGFLDGRWRLRFAVLSILLASLFFTLGSNTLLLPKLFYYLPLATVFRYPIKLMIIPVFCLALAAARGMVVVVEDRVQRRAFRAILTLSAVALLIGILFIIAAMIGRPLPVPPMTKAPQAQLLLGQAIVIGAILALSMCAVIKLMMPSYRAVVVITLLLLSLYVPAFIYRADTVSEEFYQHRPFLSQQIRRLTQEIDKGGVEVALKSPTQSIKTERLLPLYRDPVRMPGEYRWREGGSKSLNYYQYCRDLLVPNINLDCWQPETFGYEAAETADFHNFATTAMHSSEGKCFWQFCRVSATAWVSTQIDGEQEHITYLPPSYFELKMESKPMNVRLYKVKSALPRATVCSAWTWSDDHCQVSMPLEDALAFDHNPIGVPVILKDEPEHLSISANLAKPGFLLLNDQYYPGWTAHVDSVLAPIVRANGLFRAVYLPSGAHLIQFDYEPLSLFYGLVFASGAGCFDLILFWLAIKPWVWRSLLRMSGEL